MLGRITVVVVVEVALDRMVTNPVYHCSLPYMRENGIFPGNMGIASPAGLLSKYDEMRQTSDFAKV